MCERLTDGEVYGAKVLSTYGLEKRFVKEMLSMHLKTQSFDSFWSIRTMSVVLYESSDSSGEGI